MSLETGKETREHADGDLADKVDGVHLCSGDG